MGDLEIYFLKVIKSVELSFLIFLKISSNTAAPCPQISPPLAIMMIITKAEVGVCSKDVSISHKQFRVDNFIIVK